VLVLRILPHAKRRSARRRRLLGKP
jgi:hypothetical protein